MAGFLFGFDTIVISGTTEMLTQRFGLSPIELGTTVASALIGLVLLTASVVLLNTNRALLTGRGVSPTLIAHIRDVVAAQPGVVAVPDIFAVVVGPSSLIVDGDVIFDDELDVPQVEGIIVAAAAGLRARWPAVSYVYLNPVSTLRPRTGIITPSTLPVDPS